LYWPLENIGSYHVVRALEDIESCHVVRAVEDIGSCHVVWGTAPLDVEHAGRSRFII
jgi:hypothetical protein